MECLRSELRQVNEERVILLTQNETLQLELERAREWPPATMGDLYQSRRSLTLVEQSLVPQITTSRMETGSRVIFLPEQPGVYLALNVEPSPIGGYPDQDLSDTQSVSSRSSFGAAMPLA